MNYTTYKVEVYENGNKYWLNEQGQLHNEHGPAIQYADGYKAYYLNGKLNRTDGPAIEYIDGSKAYCLNGKGYSYEAWKREVEKLKVKEMTMTELTKELGYEIKIVKE